MSCEHFGKCYCKRCDNVPETCPTYHNRLVVYNTMAHNDVKPQRTLAVGDVVRMTEAQIDHNRRYTGNTMTQNMLARGIRILREKGEM